MKKCFYFPTWTETKDVLMSLDESYIIAPKIANDNYFDSNNSIKYHKTTPSNPILAKLCEITGAKIYGGYVVLDIFQGRMRGDVLRIKDDYKKEFFYEIINFTDQMCQDYEGTTNSIGLQQQIGSWNYQYDNYEYCYNILHEYSKFLRNEDNQWESIKKVMNLGDLIV